MSSPQPHINSMSLEFSTAALVGTSFVFFPTSALEPEFMAILLASPEAPLRTISSFMAFHLRIHYCNDKSLNLFGNGILYSFRWVLWNQSLHEGTVNISLKKRASPETVANHSETPSAGYFHVDIESDFLYSFEQWFWNFKWNFFMVLFSILPLLIFVIFS